MMQYSLTRQQQACLAYITARIAQDSIAPTLGEIAAHLALNSKSGAHRLVEGLEERGYIRRLKNRNRSISLCEVAGAHPDPQDRPTGPAADPETAEALRLVLERLTLSEQCRAELTRLAGAL